MQRIRSRAEIEHSDEDERKYGEDADCGEKMRVLADSAARKGKRERNQCIGSEETEHR